jgi:hypothetical protein
VIAALAMLAPLVVLALAFRVCGWAWELDDR